MSVFTFTRQIHCTYNIHTNLLSKYHCDTITSRQRRQKPHKNTNERMNTRAHFVNNNVPGKDTNPLLHNESTNYIHVYFVDDGTLNPC